VDTWFQNRVVFDHGDIDHSSEEDFHYANIPVNQEDRNTVKKRLKSENILINTSAAKYESQ
jgi:hypothetical protein